MGRDDKTGVDSYGTETRGDNVPLIPDIGDIQAGPAEYPMTWVLLISSLATMTFQAVRPVVALITAGMAKDQADGEKLTKVLETRIQGLEDHVDRLEARVDSLLAVIKKDRETYDQSVQELTTKLFECKGKNG